MLLLGLIFDSLDFRRRSRRTLALGSHKTEINTLTNHQSVDNTMTSQIEQLKALTTVVCDTGDVNAIKKFSPQDATTNPSLIYKAAVMKDYASIVDDAVAYGKGDLELTMVRRDYKCLIFKSG